MTARRSARVRDIARELSVHKSTVSSALRKLADKGLVDYAPYEVVSLTPAGLRVAQKTARKHETLRNFLAEVLAVPADRADRNACRLEHHLGPVVLSRMETFMEFLDRNQSARRAIRGFSLFVKKKRSRT